MRIEEIINILYHLGYTLHRVKGSHYSFKKQGCDTHVIPIKHGKVKQIYLRILKQIYENTHNQN